MRYTSFHIQNFKGIRDTKISLSTIAGANVFALVGLNESGKTTVLEAIHSFAPDDATSELMSGEQGVGVPFNKRVPRHLLSEFTGEVTVTAELLAEEGELDSIFSEIYDEKEIRINAEKFEQKVTISRKQKFSNGDLVVNYFPIHNVIEVKTGRQKNWREPSNQERTYIRNKIYAACPKIAYFPTFVFDFPSEIYLTDRGNKVDKFYRQVFQDILDYDGRGHTIDKDISKRIHKKEHIIGWLPFLNIWDKGDDKDKIQHVMDRAGQAVTRLVFGRWNKIFSENTKGKEVSLSYTLTEGEEMIDGQAQKTDRHDVKVKFQIRDGTRRFNVNDRSLGFRWFFSFMLFTQFRVARSDEKNTPMLFLFDEPASNLHAAAQQKLIESFPEIAKSPHVLIYSTHSHYMIDPKWLEQTYIVTNRSDEPLDSLLDQVSLDDESLDVKVSSYRSFVESHPDKTSYFQPILDRLQVYPSKFDYFKPSIVVEGKSDYYIIKYMNKLHEYNEIPIIPALGASTFSTLASLHAGWNLRLLFLLDNDRAGRRAKSDYIADLALSESYVVTINEINQSLSQIEDIIDDEAKSIIKSELGIETDVNKALILRFFQERLAANNIKELGPKFSASSKLFLEELSKKFNN